MLLLLFAGASTATPTPPTPTRVVGWPDTGVGKRRYHRPEDLERALEEQREGSALTRRRFEELLARATAKAKTAPSKARKAIKRAVAEAELVPVEAIYDPAPLMAALEAAISAQRVVETIRQARHAEAIAAAWLAELERDEEEAFMLLF